MDFEYLHPSSMLVFAERWTTFMRKIPVLFEAELKDPATLGIFKKFKESRSTLNNGKLPSVCSKSFFNLSVNCRQCCSDTFVFVA